MSKFNDEVVEVKPLSLGHNVISTLVRILAPLILIPCYYLVFAWSKDTHILSKLGLFFVCLLGAVVIIYSTATDIRKYQIVENRINLNSLVSKIHICLNLLETTQGESEKTQTMQYMYEKYTGELEMYYKKLQALDITNGQYTDEETNKIQEVLGGIKVQVKKYQIM